VQTGWEAKGTRSEVIRKKRRPDARLNVRIRSRHSRFSRTVASSRSSVYEASRNVRFAEHPMPRLMHG
jgi:hypothetical protein